MVLLAALVLLTFHGPTGARIDINPQRITSLREPRAMGEGHWGRGTHCILVMSNGKFIALLESCDVVRQAIMGEGEPPRRPGPCTLVCGESPLR